MSNFYQLIAKIKRRPSMYLGKPAISNLRSFLSGYILARRELDIPQTQEEKEFSEFQFWIQSKFKISSDQSWDKTILFFSEDEQSAIAYFFNLFDEFIASKVDKSHRELEEVQSESSIKRGRSLSETAALRAAINIMDEKKTPEFEKK